MKCTFVVNYRSIRKTRHCYSHQRISWKNVFTFQKTNQWETIHLFQTRDRVSLMVPVFASRTEDTFANLENVSKSWNKADVLLFEKVPKSQNWKFPFSIQRTSWFPKISGLKFWRNIYLVLISRETLPETFFQNFPKEVK